MAGYSFSKTPRPAESSRLDVLTASSDEQPWTRTAGMVKIRGVKMLGTI